MSYTYSATYNTVADTGITAIVSPGSFTATATTITGTISASDHGKIFTVSASKLIPKSYGLQYFTISYITCRTPTSVSSNFNAYYGVPFTAFFLSESDGSFAYSLTSSTEYIKIDEFKGVVTWDNPTGSSASFVVNLLD